MLRQVDQLIGNAGLWPVRVLWLLLAVVVTPGLLETTKERSTAVGLVIEILFASAWFIGLIALLAPSTLSLTAVRILGPAITLGLVVVQLSSGWNPAAVAAIAFSAATMVVVFFASTGDLMVNGSAYGSERRMALRAPAAVLLGPAPLAWLSVATGACIGPLLLAAKQWVVGGLLTVIGPLLIVQGTRALHQLSRRWIVFVPAGFVIHDYLSMAESILFQRRQKPVLGPAKVELLGGEAVVDLSNGAPGLALAVTVAERVPAALRRRGTIDSTTASTFIFTPSLPGALLQEARVRAIAIG